MKTNRIKSFCFLAACLVFAGCEEKFGESVTLTDITVGKGIRVNMYEVGKAQAWPVPWDCTDYEFTWESDNPAIATVDNYGWVSSVEVGTTKVYVSQGGIRKEIPVEVYEIPLLDQVTGYWEFNDAENFGKATKGDSLKLVKKGFSAVAGPDGSSAVRVEKESHFLCKHGISTSGDWVTTYTIMIDFSLPEAKRACFMQTNLYNADDVDFFLRGNMYEIGVVGGSGYADLRETSIGQIEADKWYRLVVVLKGGDNATYYLNGVNVGEKQLTGGAPNNIRMSKDGVLLFADEDGEDETIDVASVAFWGKALTARQVGKLGGL